MNEIKIKEQVPPDMLRAVEKIVSVFKDAGHEAFIVGGSVRDLLLGLNVSDYDFATDARPEKVMKLFRRTVPTGLKHGTVTLLLDGFSFEITTYRSDGKYIDGRRPADVTYSDSIEEDVKRRDFTINGLAFDVVENSVIDHVGGVSDLEKGIIRTIGDPHERFSEDGLRPFRACRFASRFNFEIEEKTFKAITDTLETASLVSSERVRDEIMKLLETEKPSAGFELMRESGLLDLVMPELAQTYRMEQNKYHMYDIYYHCLYSCDAGPESDPLIRLAALLHDIGKAPARRVGEDGDYTFYNHEILGAKITKKIMKRLKFSNDQIERVGNLVTNHMFHYTEEWTDGAVRRFMRKVGMENIEDLFSLRLADRVGNGARNGLPRPIHTLKQRIQKVIDDENAITVKDLKINGHDIMNEFGISPGPAIGRILNELLEIVLDNPEANEREFLMDAARDIFDKEETRKLIKKNAN